MTDQLKLIDTPRHTGGITQARLEMQTAMESILRHAGAVFKQRALEFVPRYLATCPDRQAEGEHITDACKAAGITVHDDRAFGPIYAILARKGVIVRAGFCPRRKGHGTNGGSIWRLVEK